MKSFSEFWPLYLAEHQNPTCRAMHYIGTTLVLLTVALVVATQNFSLLWFAPLFGYGFAWFGHFVFEKNRPATFKYPWQSLLGDFKMYFRWVTGRLDGDLPVGIDKPNSKSTRTPNHL